MEQSTQRSVQNVWLTLLLVLVLCASVASPVSLAEVQVQQVELESGFVPDAPEDGESIIASTVVVVKQSLLLSPFGGEAPSIFGSDAYPCTTLHGPPVPNHNA